MHYALTKLPGLFVPVLDKLMISFEFITKVRKPVTKNVYLLRGRRHSSGLDIRISNFAVYACSFGATDV